MHTRAIIIVLTPPTATFQKKLVKNKKGHNEERQKYIITLDRTLSRCSRALPIVGSVPGDLFPRRLVFVSRKSTLYHCNGGELSTSNVYLHTHAHGATHRCMIDSAACQGTQCTRNGRARARGVCLSRRFRCIGAVEACIAQVRGGGRYRGKGLMAKASKMFALAQYFPVLNEQRLDEKISSPTMFLCR